MDGFANGARQEEAEDTELGRHTVTTLRNPIALAHIKRSTGTASEDWRPDPTANVKDKVVKTRGALNLIVDNVIPGSSFYILWKWRVRANTHTHTHNNIYFSSLGYSLVYTESLRWQKLFRIGGDLVTTEW